MSPTLERAIAWMLSLPEPEQEKLGAELLGRARREAIDVALAEAEAEGGWIPAEEALAEARRLIREARRT